MRYRLLVLPLFFVIAHLIYAASPPINAEYQFVIAALDIVRGNIREGIHYFLEEQANPIGLSFFMLPIFKIFVSSEKSAFFWSKIPSLFGYILLMFSLPLFVSKDDKQYFEKALTWQVLVSFCPLIWVFAGRSTSDILPVGLLFFSLSLLKYSPFSQVGTLLLSSLLFGLATITKYNTAAFGLCYIALIWQMEQRSRFRSIIIFLVVSGSIFLGYLYTIYQEYGVFITHPNFQRNLSFSFKNIPMILPLYLFFTGLLIAPLIPFIPLKKFPKWKVCLILLVLAWGLFKISTWNEYAVTGEMDFGPYNKFIPLWGVAFLRTMGIFIFMFFMDIFRRQIKKWDGPIILLLIYGVFPYLLLCSTSRPAQRYLTLILPVIMALVVQFIPHLVKQFSRTFYACLWAPLLLFSSLYQWEVGHALDRTVNYLLKNNLIEKTYPGALLNNQAQHFRGKRTDHPSYMVAWQVPKSREDKVLNREEVRILGYLFKEVFVYKN